MQTFTEPFNPAYVRQGDIEGVELGLSCQGPRLYIARRAFAEIRGGDVVNLGIGIPEGVAEVAKAENRLADMVLTVESGPIGGVPAGGLSFGASTYPMAIVDQPYMFDFYDGGGLDVAFLSMAECDRQGNVNVSRFAGRLAGAGGFMNISETARKVVFLGTFTAGGLATEVEDGKLHILSEGDRRKFVREVSHVTFSGALSVERGRDVIYITERAVFRLRASGLELVEIAAGIDVERDVLAHMDFVPAISRELRRMSSEVFK
jgi:propionate CoA-transferase